MLLFYCLWFYILGSRKLALDLDYRLDNELKSIMTQLVICIFLARFVQFALNLWLFLMMLFALMSCGVLSHSGFTTLSVLSANSLLVSDAVFQNPLDIHIHFIRTNDKHDNSTEKI